MEREVDITILKISQGVQLQILSLSILKAQRVELIH